MHTMIKSIKNLLLRTSSPGSRWLSDKNTTDRIVISRFVETEVSDEKNRIALVQDPETQKFWIRHYMTQEFGDWFEFQPISNEQAEALKEDKLIFRDYVSHD